MMRFVRRVSDGDSFYVTGVGLYGRRRERVRLRGVYAPERSTPSGRRARKYLSSVLPRGSLVFLTVTGVDRYGRLVCDVRLGSRRGRDVNALVEDYLYRSSRRPPD